MSSPVHEPARTSPPVPANGPPPVPPPVPLSDPRYGPTHGPVRDPMAGPRGPASTRPRGPMSGWRLRDFEDAARERLAPAHYDYFAGGAGEELTLRANEAAFDRLALVPRVLRGAGKPETGVTLLNSRASMPVLVAPTAFHRLADPQGERATARAAAAAETIMIVSMAATVAVEEVAAAAPGAELWFQLYVQPDLAFTERVVRRAESAGCTALVVTADSPVMGVRERDVRNGFHDLPAHLHCENLRDHPGGPVRPIVMWPELSWEHLAVLRRMTDLPLVVKGVTHPADARLAIDHGAAAILVSNHGGRQLDGMPAAIDLLPDVVAEVAGAVPVLMDGGVRRGTDVVKALALGAAAVGVGRPVLWGLAAGGEAGAAGVLGLLRAQFEEAMTLCGCAGVAGLSRDMVRDAVRDVVRDAVRDVLRDKVRPC